MISPSSIIVVAGLLFVLAYKYILYPAFGSPLSALPTAHPLCSITSKWFDRQILRQKELTTLFAAHQKHGPIVRLGPQEVSVVSLEGLRNIYTAGLEKHPWYAATFENYGTPNLVSTLEHRPHSVQKRMIANVYAKSYIQHSIDVDTLSTGIVFERFLPLLQKYADERDHVNVMHLFQWAGIDFMTAYIFGTAHCSDFLEDKEGREAYFKDWSKIRNFDNSGENNVVEGLCMKLSSDTLAAQDHSQNNDIAGTNPVVFSKLYSQLQQKAKAEGNQLSQTDLMKRCASELLDHIVATHETFAITSTYVLYRMSLDPALQKKLRAELLALDPSVTLGAAEEGLLPSPDQIDALPLLNGIIQETLRLHAAVPVRQPRVVPKGGIMLHSHYIPAGTTVSSNAYSIHRQPEIFPRRSEWLPQRWMVRDDRSPIVASFPGPEVIRRWFWAFGSGGRMCIGSNFALQ
ncbi:hypothetical protein LTR37_021444, partial [Vermiconidia calcicola]